jgi:hypothetical protein
MNASYCSSSALTTARALLIVGELPFHLFAHALGGLAQRVRRQEEPGRARYRGQQQLGGLRIFALGEVVRHVSGEPDRVMALLAQAELQQVGDARRHSDACDPRLVPAISSGRVPWAVIPVGRVCGTDIGMAWMPIVRRTPSCGSAG